MEERMLRPGHPLSFRFPGNQDEAAVELVFLWEKSKAHDVGCMFAVVDCMFADVVYISHAVGCSFVSDGGKFPDGREALFGAAFPI